MTFAFIEQDAALPSATRAWSRPPIANPLSEKFAVLRPSLLPGLVDACAHNRRRERKDVRLFETGSRFTADGEGRAVAASSGAAPRTGRTGRRRRVRSTSSTPRESSRDLRGGRPRGPVHAAPGRDSSCPGRAADVRAATARTLGVVGKLLPAIAEARGFPAAEDVFVAELDLRRARDAGAGGERLVDPLPRYPSIVRDISMLVDEALPAAAVRGTIRSSAPPTLVSIVEFDRYQGKGVPDGRVSLSLRLTFRAPDRTLTDDEVQSATGRIVEALRTAHGAEQR